jgi:hypothetical protein
MVRGIPAGSRVLRGARTFSENVTLNQNGSVC